MQDRTERLMPNGVPRYIRCYDNGTSYDRYTVVFTGKYRESTGGNYWYLGMSENPHHPQGMGYHGSADKSIDRPKYAHLGKRIKFEQLPPDCQKETINTYKYLWDIKEK